MPSFADETTDAAWAHSAEMMKQSGNRVFYGFYLSSPSQGSPVGQGKWVKGYQAIILSQLCPEVYGQGFTGEIPPFMRSGLKKALTLRQRFGEIAKKCEKSSLVSELLTEYWFNTGTQVETFLSRLSRLASAEPVVFYDEDVPNGGGTASTEKAIRAGENSQAIAAAMKRDSALAVIHIFGDVSRIYRSILQRIDMKNALSELLSDQDTQGALDDLMTVLAFSES